MTSEASIIGSLALTYFHYWERFPSLKLSPFASAAQQASQHSARVMV